MFPLCLSAQHRVGIKVCGTEKGFTFFHPLGSHPNNASKKHIKKTYQQTAQTLQWVLFLMFLGHLVRASFCQVAFQCSAHHPCHITCPSCLGNG